MPRMRLQGMAYSPGPSRGQAMRESWLRQPHPAGSGGYLLHRRVRPAGRPTVGGEVFALGGGFLTGDRPRFFYDR